MPASPPYLTYLNYVEAWITLGLEVSQLIVWCYLLYCARFRPRLMIYYGNPNGSGLSASMILFICTHLLNCLMSIPYHCYVVAYWHPPPDPPMVVLGNGGGGGVEPMFNIDVLFWLGLWTQNYMATIPLAVLILTADRFLIHLLHAPFGDQHRWQKVFIACGAVSLVMLYAGSTLVDVFELPLNRPAVASCENFSCLALKYRTRPQLLMKLVVGSVNVAMGIAFLYRLHHSSVAVNIVSGLFK